MNGFAHTHTPNHHCDVYVDFTQTTSTNLLSGIIWPRPENPDVKCMTLTLNLDTYLYTTFSKILIIKQFQNSFVETKRIRSRESVNLTSETWTMYMKLPADCDEYLNQSILKSLYARL